MWPLQNLSEDKDVVVNCRPFRNLACSWRSMASISAVIRWKTTKDFASEGQQWVKSPDCCSLLGLLSVAASWNLLSSNHPGSSLCPRRPRGSPLCPRRPRSSGMHLRMHAFVAPPLAGSLHVDRHLLQPWHSSLCGWHLCSLVMWWHNNDV